METTNQPGTVSSVPAPLLASAQPQSQSHARAQAHAQYHQQHQYNQAHQRTPSTGSSHSTAMLHAAAPTYGHAPGSGPGAGAAPALTTAQHQAQYRYDSGSGSGSGSGGAPAPAPAPIAAPSSIPIPIPIPMAVPPPMQPPASTSSSGGNAAPHFPGLGLTRTSSDRVSGYSSAGLGAGQLASRPGSSNGLAGVGVGADPNAFAGGLTAMTTPAELPSVLLETFKRCLREADTYIAYYEARLKADEEYNRALRAVMERQRELDARFDGGNSSSSKGWPAGVGVGAGSARATGNALAGGRGMRGAWYELRENDVRGESPGLDCY